MKNTKRVLPVLIIALLTLSFILPLANVAALLNPPQVSPGGNVQVGDIQTIQSQTTGEVPSGATVTAYWDYVEGPDLLVLNSTRAKPNGSYIMNVTVPETPAGDHYIQVKYGTDSQGTMVTVIPKITVDPTSGLVTDDIVVDGTGFGEEKDVDIIIQDSATWPPTWWADLGDDTTDEAGSFTYTFDVPAASYGNYWINATDEDGNEALISFTVGAAFEIDPVEGPSGTVVDVTGRGFYPNVPLGNTNFTIDSTNLIVVDTITTDGSGDFAGQVVIPSLSIGDYVITCTDGMGNVTTDNFKCTGETEIDITPTFGSPGATIHLEGYNFTAIAGKQVMFTYDSTSLGVNTTTRADGTFSYDFIVPADVFTSWTITAEDSNGLSATHGFKIGIIAIIISPTSGPSGTKVTLTGTGFDASGTFNATFGDKMVIEGGSISAQETLSTTFYVPTVAPGAYTLLVEDSADNELDTTFVVTETTSLEADPSDVAIGYNLTLNGMNFAEKEGGDLEFWISNSTWEMEITVLKPDSLVSPVKLLKWGNFTGYWPVSDLLILGNTYTINATDGIDPHAETTITIVEEEVEIGPNKASYSLGDTITFRLKATFQKKDSYLEITDPDGELYFKSTFAMADWVKIDPWWVVQIRRQTDDASGYPFIIPTDANTGTWTWTLYDSDDEVIFTGTIEVLPTTAEQVDTRLGALESGLVGLGDTIGLLSGDLDVLSGDVGSLSGKFDVLSGDVSSLTGDVGALDAKVSGLSGDVDDAIKAAQDASSKVDDLGEVVADIADVASNAATASANAAKAAENAATSADDAKTATGGLSTLVYGAIGASLVAAIAAIFAVMQISRRIAG